MVWHIRLSVRLSVRPSVRHTLVLCQNEGTQRDAVFAAGNPSVSDVRRPRMDDGGGLYPGTI